MERLHTARPRGAEEAEFDAVSRCLGRAFHDDPLAAFFFPDEATRAQRFASFSHFVLGLMSRHGAITTCDPIRGAAVWQAPSPPKLGRLQGLYTAFQMAARVRGAVARVATAGELTSKNHPREPHWYLAILGTEPESQGQGIGSALLGATLPACDQAGLPAYLESSKESNIPFYERHGFRVVGEISIPQGPTLWRMSRPAP